MKKTLATSLSAMFLLGTSVAVAQEKDGFASEGGLGTTRIEALSGTDLGSGRYAEVEWTYLKDQEAYGAKLPSRLDGADKRRDARIAICSRPRSDSLLQFEIQMVMSDGTIMLADALKDLETRDKLGNFEIQDLRVTLPDGSTRSALEDRECKALPKEAKGLMAKKPVALDYLVITMEN